MATYYVRTDGSNTNTGTGTGTGQAWATVAHALGGTGTASGVVGGDVIYIAPGRYTGVTVGISPSSVVSVIGDPSATQFGGAIPAGPIYITNQTNDRSVYSGSVGLTLSSRNNFSFANLVFGGISSVTSHNLTFDKCYVHGWNGASGSSAFWSFSANTNANLTVKNCAFFWFANRTIEITCANHTSSYTSNIRFENTYIQTNSTFAMNNATGLLFTNCNTSSIGVTGTVVSSATYQNSVMNIGTLSGSAGGNLIEDYNVFNLSSRSNVAAGSNSVNTSNLLNYGDYMTITGTMTMPMLSPPSTVFNQLIGYGTTTNAPATDFYGATYGTPMTVGPVKSQTLTGAGIYQPTERNASTITIAPGSTSQSIELYLGVTGLTASTSGLSARYNRTRTASVSIPLVARTITQAWTAGGFAEVDATNMPGVYRLDVPDAALAAGADDVTVVVRGASGTNGAVMTVKLSSGGLSSTETAQAVWNATASSYNTAGSMGEAGQRLTGYSLASSQTFSTTGSVGSVTSAVTIGTNNDKTGYALSSAANTSAAAAVWNSQTSAYTTHGSYGWNVLRADAQSKEGLVTLHQSGGISRVDADVHAIANDTDAATELKGALLHNGTDYISAELLTPVSAATSVHIGPYQLLADGLGADQPLDVNVGTATSIDVQITDANGTGIDITGATVSAKVYNAGGTLVATYAGTATYADNGRLTFGLTTTVTNTSGTYTVTVTRTTGASDTQVFGPLKLYVRPV